MPAAAPGSAQSLPAGSGGVPWSLVRLLAALALGLVLLNCADLALDVLRRNPPSVFTDWHNYYRAATNIRSGGDLYHGGRLLVEHDSYDYWRREASDPAMHDDYAYPPLLAILLVPLTLLDVKHAGVLWLGALLLATAGFLWAILRALGSPVRLETVAVVGVASLAGSAAGPFTSVVYGEIDLVLLLLITLSLLAYQHRRDVLAGVILGLAAAVKPTLAFYGLFYLRKRCWSTLAAATLTGAAAGLGPFALLGPGALGDWITIARYFGTGSYATWPGNQSLYGLLLHAFVGGPSNEPLLESRLLADVLWRCAAVGTLALWWCSLPGRPARDARAAGEYALTTVAMLFVAPLSWTNHYMLVLLPLAVLADRAAWVPVSRRWVLLAVAGCLYYAQPWLFAGDAPGLPNLLRLALSSAYLYGLLPVGVALAILVRRDAQRCAPPLTDTGHTPRPIDARLSPGTVGN